MARVAVRCVWLLLENDGFYDAVDLAHTLECDMWIDWLHLDTEYDEHGYVLLAVFIASEDEKFLMTYGNTLNLYGYVDCVACDVVEASLIDSLDLEPLSFIMQGRSDLRYDEFMYIAKRNRIIRDDEVLWIYAKLDQKKLSQLNVRLLGRLLEDVRVTVIYIPGSIDFYLKIQKFPGFHLWLDELKRTLPLNYWVLMHTLLEKLPGTETLPQLTTETLETFLNEIAKYQ